MTTILQLSDLHIGPHNDEKDQKNLRFNSSYDDTLST